MPFKRGIITLMKGPGSYFVFGDVFVRLELKVRTHQGRDTLQAQIYIYIFYVSFVYTSYVVEVDGFVLFLLSLSLVCKVTGMMLCYFLVGHVVGLPGV